MRWIEHGGIPKKALPLCGWPKYGIPGVEIVIIEARGHRRGGSTYTLADLPPTKFARIVIARRIDEQEIKEILFILSASGELD